MSALQSDSVLPPLRGDLQLKTGIRELDGSRTWTILDPLRQHYFQIDFKNLQILDCWIKTAGRPTTAGAIVDQLVWLSVSLEDIEELLRFLWKNSLTLMPPNDDLAFYLKQSTHKAKQPLKRLLHGYLFFRVPLVRPNRFLKKTEPLSRIFFTKAWWSFIGICLLLGLFLTSRQWDQFTHTFSHFFTFEGLFYFALSMVFVKCLHELGHGYAATRYGCKISTMGVAFIVCFPVLFTDTTDSWRLDSRKKRLIISSAGVAVEISLAVIATLLWAFLEDGPLRSAAFFVATTSWIMSLLVNLNPLMRFDAYHFLSDALGVQNLQSRSFALGRWRMRELLFGLEEPVPEAMYNGMRRGLTVFAWCTWVYRLFLFLGIAMLIHSYLHKPFGTILAGIEILFFIAIPIMKELNEWWTRRATIVSNQSSWATATAVVLLLMMFMIPWQSTIRMPAVMEAAEATPVYAPQTAQVAELYVRPGESVQSGDLLITLKSTELDNQIIAAQRRIELVSALLSRIAADASDRNQKIVLDTELKQWQEELAGLEIQKNDLQLKAQFDGVVTDLVDDLHPGRWVGENTRLGTLVSNEGGRIRGYVTASDVGRIKEGAEALFVSDVPEHDHTTGVIRIVDSANADNLTIPELTSHYDGPIAVNQTTDEFKPLNAWYHISVDMNSDHSTTSRVVRGTLLADGTAESLASRFWRRAVHVVLREVVI